MKKVRIVFWIYCTVMLWLLFGQRMGKVPAEDYWILLRENLNLQPFDTLRRFWWVLEHSDRSEMVTHAFSNLAGNVILFIPLGLCLPPLWRKLERFVPFVLFVAALITAVELVQLFTLLGSCDVDDLLLNLLGAAVGFFLLKLGRMIRKAGDNPSK